MKVVPNQTAIDPTEGASGAFATTPANPCATPSGDIGTARRNDDANAGANGGSR